jgi:L-ascorbate metabolism protein UlaG (beta-lactamase superfamily)
VRALFAVRGRRCVRWLAGLVLLTFAAVAVPAAAQKSELAQRRFALAAPKGTPVVDSGSLYFVGNATTILRYAGYTVLTDPSFTAKGARVALGYGLSTERLTEPALTLERLPPIDLIVLSQLREDHFDAEVQAKLDKNIPIVTTPAAAKQLRKLGFKSVYALDRWQAVNAMKGDWQLKITALPARNGPVALAAFMPAVMGSMLEFQTLNRSTAYRVYVTGDTVVIDDLKEKPLLFRDVDLALLHLGGMRMAGLLATMDAKQGLEALKLVQADVAIPVHHDDYTVYTSPVEDFLSAAKAAGLEQKVRQLRAGETFTFRIPPGRLK